MNGPGSRSNGSGSTRSVAADRWRKAATSVTVATRLTRSIRNVKNKAKSTAKNMQQAMTQGFAGMKRGQLALARWVLAQSSGVMTRRIS